MANILPPPPSSQKVTSDAEGLVRAWADWFFRVAQILEASSTGSSSSVVSVQSFAAPALPPRPELLAPDMVSVLVNRSFSPPEQISKAEMAAFNTDSILANQIFGD